MYLSGRELITTTCTTCSSLRATTCRNIRCRLVIVLDAASSTRSGDTPRSNADVERSPSTPAFVFRSALAVFHERFQASQLAVNAAAAPHQHEDIGEHDDPCRRIAVKEVEFIRFHSIKSPLHRVQLAPQ